MDRNDLIPVITQEECAEVIQAISKMFRFGPHQHHPITRVSNRDHLSEEIGQLKYMLDKLVDYYELNHADDADAYVNKQASLDKYEDYFPF
jgi:NTP pyrophosphatase (non-canonical NTP hydrolase)